MLNDGLCNSTGVHKCVLHLCMSLCVLWDRVNRNVTPGLLFWSPAPCSWFLVLAVIQYNWPQNGHRVWPPNVSMWIHFQVLWCLNWREMLIFADQSYVKWVSCPLQRKQRSKIGLKSSRDIIIFSFWPEHWPTPDFTSNPTSIVSLFQKKGTMWVGFSI